MLLLSAIGVILRAPGPLRAHCCLLQTRRSGSLCPLAPSAPQIPDNHANIPPLSFFTGRMPFLPPNQQCQSTEGTVYVWIKSLRVSYSCCKVGWVLIGAGGYETTKSLNHDQCSYSSTATEHHHSFDYASWLTNYVHKIVLICLCTYIYGCCPFSMLASYPGIQSS